MPTPKDFHASQIPNLVNKLIRFLGSRDTGNALEKYSRSLKMAGPIYTNYYLKYRHPWWHALQKYYELERAGKSIGKNLSDGIRVLAGDAKKIIELQRFMPEEVRKKYKRDLIDDDRAYDYLFELYMAWHFYLKGYSVEWYDDKNRPEFLVKTPDFEFNVECKRISTDIARKVHRSDFYRLADKLIPKVSDLGYTGLIEIALSDRLSGDDASINNIVVQAVDKLNSGCVNSEVEVSLGFLSFRLEPVSGKTIDFKKQYENLKKRMPQNAHAAVFAGSKNNLPMDPIELIVYSQQNDYVLDGIMDRVKSAVKRQLDTSKPGVVFCFLEGVDDLEILINGSELQKITSILLLREDFSHVAGIGYCSEINRVVQSGAHDYFGQGLIFSNPKCKFKKIEGANLLSNSRSFQYRLSDFVENNG